MKKKKVIKVIALIAFVLISIFFLYNLSDSIRSGKQVIRIRKSNYYFSGSNLETKITVEDEKNNSIKSNLNIELLNSSKKKVPKANEKISIQENETADVSMKLPDNLETGTYYLKITSKSGIKKDSIRVPINILKDKESNIIVSFDKGIYKPGDEVNFRALVVSKKDDKPTQTDVSVNIYDGNDNKVYSNKVKTSEYGIVSGKFNLADELNSGTYKMTVSTEDQELSKNFIVNPYVTPQYEATITTDKENYILGEDINLTLQAKYFFGEPVKNATAVLNINGNEVKGLTNEEGVFSTTYKTDKLGNIDINSDITDTSNYLVQANKKVYVGTDIYEIEMLPEFGDLITGITNDVYVLTKTANGTPIKTYSNITLGKITRQVITDEKGIGSFTLSADDINSLSKKDVKNISITSEDMNGNKVSKTVELELAENNGTIINTNKTKYNSEEDIEINLNHFVDINKSDIYVFKGKELLKTISTESDNLKINLGDTTGLVDIYVSTNYKQNNNYRYSQYENWGTRKKSNEFYKKTIFIKPDKKLNIQIEKDKEQYNPGENINLKFTTTDQDNNTIDSALLVSILDEAILNLAENDLSIDNIKLALEDIKLALEDIKLTDGITAADLYASVLEENSDITLNALLLKQENKSLGIDDFRYRKDYDDIEENIRYAIISGALLVIILLIWIVSKARKNKKFTEGFAALLEIFIIFLILLTSFGEKIYDLMYEITVYYEWLSILTVFVISIVLYNLILYKNKKYISKLIIELIVIPMITIIPLIILGSIFDSDAIILICLALLALYTILVVRKRNGKLNKYEEKFIDIFYKAIKGCVFWFVTALILEITELGLIISIFMYIIVDKYVLSVKKDNKIENGKIVLNITGNELIGLIVGIIFILFIIVGIRTMFGTFSAPVTDSMGTMTDAGNSFNDSEIIYNDESESDRNFSWNASVNSSKENKGNDLLELMEENGHTYEKSENINTDKNETKEIEKLTETEENIRNVFLESLAFIPEVVTENGKNETQIKLSDNITTWNIQVLGNTKNGNIGYAQNTFKVFKEFFVEFNLPTNSVVSDKISIPVTLHNYTENELNINVDVKECDWCKIGEYTKVVKVPAKQTTMVYVPIEILKSGNNTLRIETKAGEISDIVEKTMKTNINGLEKTSVVSNGYIKDNMKQDIIFNEKAIPETKNLKLKLYSSSITQTVENIEGILKLPTGCFEQTSSALYPDVLVLKYLKNNEIENNELKEKALEYISKGYQKLLTYEVKGTKGGYSLYGNAPAETVITAFGLMEFKEISEVYEVDENVLQNAKEFLFKNQRVDGSFDFDSTYIGGAKSSDKLAMSAYITWAISETYPEESKLDKSIKYLEKNIKETNDNYTLALMANVFANTKNEKLAKEVIEKILSTSKKEADKVYITAMCKDYYGSYGRLQNIQTTALTSLALSKLNYNQKTNNLLIDYIISSKVPNGTWGTTQATILALKAINEFEKDSDIKNQTIKITVNGETKEIKIDENSLDVYEIDYNNVKDENSVSIEMEKGKIRYEIIKEYCMEYSDVKNNYDISVLQNINTELKVNDTINQTINIKNNYEKISNGIIQVNIPQGATVLEDSLLKLKVDGKIEKYEYNYDKLNLYIRNLDKSKELNLDVQYRAMYPVNITGAGIRFFDYYNPEVETIVQPIKINVNN